MKPGLLSQLKSTARNPIVVCFGNGVRMDGCAIYELSDSFDVWELQSQIDWFRNVARFKSEKVKESATTER